MDASMQSCEIYAFNCHPQPSPLQTLLAYGIVLEASRERILNTVPRTESETCPASHFPFLETIGIFIEEGLFPGSSI